MHPPQLAFSEAPVHTTPFCDDPWDEADDSDSDAQNDGRSCQPSGRYSVSTRSSRTSSTSSHVLPESAFLSSDGLLLLDPYFGKYELATLISAYLTRTFHCATETASSRALGQPTLPVFIAQTIYLSNAPDNAVSAALILLQRFHSKHPPAGLSGHMLWLAALIIACTSDSVQNLQEQNSTIKNAMSAAWWSQMTLYGEREVDEMYRELWDGLEGNVIVFPSYASAMENLANPLEEKKWMFDDADEEDEEEVKDAGADEPPHGLWDEKRSVKPIKSKTHLKSHSSSSIRTRIASLFSRKA